MPKENGGLDPFYGLTPEVVGDLQISIVAFFDAWKQQIIDTLNAVASLGTLLDSLGHEDVVDIQRWENEGGA